MAKTPLALPESHGMELLSMILQWVNEPLFESYLIHRGIIYLLCSKDSVFQHLSGTSQSQQDSPRAADDQPLTLCFSTQETQEDVLKKQVQLSALKQPRF